MVETLIAAILLAVQPATASDGADPAALSAAPAAAPDIVVRGDRARKRKVDSLLRQISPRAPDHPLARFSQPPCISIRGFRQDFGLGIAQRLMTDLQRVKLPTGGDKCRPNMRILVLSPTDFATVRREAGASDTNASVIIHQVAVTHSGDGDPVIDSGAAGNVPTLKLGRASNIGNPIRVDVQEATLIFSSAILPGKTAGQLADYAMMRLFAQLEPPAHAGVPTILTLFEPDREAVPGLTAFDDAYLDGLYGGSPTERWGATFGRIRQAMKAGADAPAEATPP